MYACNVIHSLKLAQTDAINSMPIKFFSHLGTSNCFRGLYLTPSYGNPSMEKNDYIDNENSLFHELKQRF